MSVLSHKSPPPPCAIVIFGANGDLTRRLIIPALYNLARTQLLPRSLSLIGVDHNKKNSEEWTAQLRGFLAQALDKNNEEVDENLWLQVARCMTFLSGDFEQPDTYQRLKDLLAELDEKQSLNGNVLFYMAVADRFFNRAFVSMQYFGYLRRDPNSGPDTDFAGYNFWLNKLNSFNGDYVKAEMVKAFLSSLEYRKRFAP